MCIFPASTRPSVSQLRDWVVHQAHSAGGAGHHGLRAAADAGPQGAYPGGRVPGGRQARERGQRKMEMHQ